MAHAIVTHLNTWHTGSEQPTQTYSHTLHLAVQQQNNIGWQSFIEGFWSSQWRAHQQQYLSSIKSKRSSLLWISKLQRRIWLIPWKMWEHRNNVLHANGAIHQYEIELLQQEISKEWLHQHSLSQQYRNLFRGTLHQKLQTPIHQQKRWIVNVWAAQEKLGTVRMDRDEHILNIFDRWKSTCN